MDDKRAVKSIKQTLILENREKLSVTGVIDVGSFNDQSIVAVTDLGILIIRGAELHINKLNLDNSELIIDGDIFSIEYTDEEMNKSKSLFGKLFK